MLEPTQILRSPTRSTEDDEVPLLFETSKESPVRNPLFANPDETNESDIEPLIPNKPIHRLAPPKKGKKSKIFFAILIATLLSLGMGALAFMAGLALAGLPLAILFSLSSLFINIALYSDTILELLEKGPFQVRGKKMSSSGKLGTTLCFSFSFVTATALACATFVAILGVLSVVSGGTLPLFWAMLIAGAVAAPSAVGNTFLFLGPFRRFFALISSKEARKEFVDDLKRSFNCKILVDDNGKPLLDKENKPILARNLYTSTEDDFLHDKMGKIIFYKGRELTRADLASARTSREEKMHTVARWIFRGIFFSVAITFAVLASLAWIGLFNNGFTRFLDFTGAAADKTAQLVATWCIRVMGFIARFPVFAEGIAKQADRFRSFMGNVITDFKNTFSNIKKNFNKAIDSFKNHWRDTLDLKPKDRFRAQAWLICKALLTFFAPIGLLINTVANGFVVKDGLPTVHEATGHTHDEAMGALAQASGAIGSGAVCINGVENAVEKAWNEPSYRTTPFFSQKKHSPSRDSIDSPRVALRAG